MSEKTLHEKIKELAPTNINAITGHYYLKLLYVEERDAILADISAKIQLILDLAPTDNADRLRELIVDKIRAWVSEKLSKINYDEYVRVMKGFGRRYLRQGDFAECINNFVGLQDLIARGLKVPPSKQPSSGPPELGSRLRNKAGQTARVRGIKADCTLIVFIDETPEEKGSRKGPKQGHWEPYKIDLESLSNKKE